MTTSHSRWLRASWLVLPLVAPLVAQTASRTPPDEAVELSPFEVSTQSNRGYVASESMTGSRVATQIKDLPFSVNVLTSEFFDDFGIFELGENVAYISSFTGLDQGGGFNLRGFNATNQLRDGFYRLGRYGSSNVDRVEVIKGPNAAIYGQTSPGGMLNMISKKPKKMPGQRLSVSAGDYDTFRSTFEATGPLGSFLGDNFYITTLGYYERTYQTPMAALENHEGYLALRHEFKDKSSLLVQFEYFLRKVSSPTSPAPFILDDKNTPATTDDEIVGIAKNLGKLQQYGPRAELNRGMTFLTGTYEKQFNSIFSSRVSSNYYRARRWDMYQNQTAANVNQRTLLMQRGTGTPNKGIIFEDGGGLQGDILAHYWLGDRAIENRTLLTFDYSVYYRYDPNWSITGAPQALWNSIRTISVTPDLSGAAAPIQYLTGPYDWTSQTLGRKNKNRTTSVGTLLRHQMGFINGRLLVFGGARFDKVNYNLRDLAANRQNTFKFDQIVPNLGANYAVTPNLRVYANYSESFFPNAQFITAASITPGYKSETAQGFDYGLKGSYLNDRLNFTASIFAIDRQNVVVQELDLVTGVLINRPEGNQEVQGFELDLNWLVSDDLTIGGSFG